MKKNDSVIYVCQSCGAVYPKWSGKCAQCGEWNCLVEERAKRSPRKHIDKIDFASIAVKLDEIEPNSDFRVPTSMREFDRVTGGGLVSGSSLLLAGDPGIGKSTLLLQTAGALAQAHHRVLYVSGEESPQQMRNRADRLGISTELISIAATSDLQEIKAIIEQEFYSFVVVDSIQTLRSRAFESSPGTVTQIRECVADLQDLCAVRGTGLLLIGHITKEGAIAGPKVLEHMVDVVLYFEGDKSQFYRILRSQKNRFGATSEIGIFTIDERGLSAVENPSELFLTERACGISGQVVVCSLEGARPILFELQALVTDSTYGVPQRVSSGFDQKRLNLLLAILEKKEKFRLAAKDVFINLAGGLRLVEPALDLGVVTAIVSSYEDVPVRDDTVIVGEVGLGGEIRSVPNIKARITEASSLGFRRIVLPERNAKTAGNNVNIEIAPVSHLTDAFSAAFK